MSRSPLRNSRFVDEIRRSRACRPKTRRRSRPASGFPAERLAHGENASLGRIAGPGRRSLILPRHPVEDRAQERARGLKDPELAKHHQHDFRPATYQCTADPIFAELGGFRMARDQTLAVPLGGLDLSRGRDLFVTYLFVENTSVEPDPRLAQVYVDGEKGSFTGYHNDGSPNTRRAVFVWDSWPADPQLLTMSYSDGNAPPLVVDLAFRFYGCALLAGPTTCYL